MRGAGLRLNNDVRRLWRCANCGVERRIGADVTSVRCHCPGHPAMKLIEARRLERPLKELASPYLEFEFEPGELNPPQPPEDERPAPPPENLSAEEVSDSISSEGGTDAEPTASEAERPRPPARPPRRDDRRDQPRVNRSSGQPRGGQGRSDDTNRRDNSSRRNTPPSPQPRQRVDSVPTETHSQLEDAADPETIERTTEGDEGTEGRPPRRRNRRRRKGPRPEGSSPEGERTPPPRDISFGEGIAGE